MDWTTGIDRRSHRLKEECLARKRNQEYHKQLFWNDITNYYKTWDARSAKYNVWVSLPQTPTSKDEKCQSSKNLEERRFRLSRLLADEHEQYEQELQKSRSSRNATRSPKKVNIEMKLKEKENCHHESLLKKYTEWKNSHVTDRKLNMDKKKIQESMKNCWNEQMKEKQMQKERERKLALELEEENMKKRIQQEELEKEALAKKKEEMNKLRSYLLQQMEEVKKRDELTRQIKLQEQRDIKLKTEIETIAVQRNKLEKERRNRELFSCLHRQYQLQLKQRTKQIQQELEEDKRFIEQVTKCFEEEEMKNHLVREETRKQIDRANALLNEFSRLEKQREKEMDFLFYEEAKKLWHKQDARWNAEQEARNNLMRDVIVTIQKQIKEKLEKNSAQHAKLVEEKEQLLKDIEALDLQLKEKDFEQKVKKNKYREDLEKQIREKQLLKEAIEEKLHSSSLDDD